MAYREQSKEEVKKNVINNLSWEVAQRDDEEVARAIHEGEELDGVYGLSEVGLLDGFWEFMKEVGIFELIETIEARGIKRVIIPVVQYVIRV